MFVVLAAVVVVVVVVVAAVVGTLVVTPILSGVLGGAIEIGAVLGTCCRFGGAALEEGMGAHSLPHRRAARGQ